MAQSVERPTLVFGSGHDLIVCQLEPHFGLGADSIETAWDSLSPSQLALPPAQFQKKKKKKEKKKIKVSSF